MKQVCLLERVRRVKGEETTETVCAVTGLGPERASAGRLLAIAGALGDREPFAPGP